jgi:hypothetical protein
LHLFAWRELFEELAQANAGRVGLYGSRLFLFVCI